MAGEGMSLLIPRGIDDFKKLRDGGYYFVDKSELISDILRDGSEVLLFTRPRRFGKSLNLSMLDAFFNLEYKGNSWFDGLKINDHPEAEKHRSVYPVIHLDMKYTSVKNYDLFLSKVRGMLSRLFVNFRYLRDSDRVPENFRKLYFDEDPIFFDEQRVRDSILTLCIMLYMHHGVKPIVLIDEYDDAINKAYGMESYDEILEFLRDFYLTTLKGNDYLSFAVVTGVMQIAKEGIFSGLNNLSVNNIFCTEFDERYGFIESEIKELCSYYGHPEKFDEAKEWYNGYRFGDADIYNPWSVLSYVKFNFKPKTYWGGTSGNEILDILLKNADVDTFKALTILGNGKTITKILPESVMKDLKTKSNAIFSVLAVAGYLNAVPKEEEYILSIPNREMYQVFYDHIVNYAFEGDDPFKNLLDSLETGDTARVKHELDLFYNNFSSLLLVDEGRYHVILAAIILGRIGKYVIEIDRESGNGRHDIFMRTRYPRYPNIVVEIKKAEPEDSDATVQHLAEKALQQIHEKDYCRGMTGKTFLYGIAFRAKTATVLFEETVL